MISKNGKLRSDSQGDHPAALIIYEEGNRFALKALNFCFVFFQEPRLLIELRSIYKY